MATVTNITEYRRQRRHKNAGKTRKAENRKGTTPAFPIHTPEADANAPKAQLKPEE
jgi:hypothetical protein